MFMVLGMFLISFTTALTYQQDKEVNLTVTCLNDGYCDATTICNINVIDPNGDKIVDGENMDYYTSSFKYNLTNNLLGKYLVSGYCTDGIIQDEINYEYNVNLSGQDSNAGSLLSTIFLILAFSGLIFVVWYSKDGKKYERMYKNIMRKYEQRNYVKFVTNTLWYNVLKNSWVMYYTIGFVIMMLLFDLTYLFNIESIFRLMKMFLSMYSWGFIVVGILFLSYLQEFMIDMKEELTNNNWGISNE